MNPEPPAQSPGLATASPTRGVRDAAPRRRGLRLRAALGLLGLGGAVLAAGTAYGLSQVPGLEQPWAAAAGAALAFVVAGLPCAWLLGRLVRDLLRHGEASGPDAVLGAWMPRPLFMELAGREWARARRYGSGAAVLLVDLDRHASLAESHGADKVDAVMHEVLRLTAATLRPADLITRYGEARLAVFLAHADATGALDVAERIRERFDKLDLPQLQAAGSAAAGPWTASLGVAHLRPAHLNLAALLDDAEDAVIAARQAGGNCVRCAPVEFSRLRIGDVWRGDDRRARPKQGGQT